MRPVNLAVITNSANWDLNSVPTFLQSTVFYLKHLKNVTIELLTQSYEDGWTIPIIVVADLDGEIDSKLMIEDGIGALRMRRVAIFAIKHNSKGGRIVVIESEPAHMRIYKATQDQPEVKATLQSATHNFIKAQEGDTLDNLILKIGL